MKMLQIFLNLTKFTALSCPPRRDIGFRYPVLLAIASTFLVALPGTAAEKIHLKYDALNLEISVKSLARYAKSGKADPELDAYLGLLPTKAKDNLRHLLVTAPSEGTNIEHVLNAPMGQAMLTEIGEIVQTSTEDNGSDALQKAITDIAKQPNGLTPINLMKSLETDVHINIERLVRLLNQRHALAKEAKSFLQDFSQRTARRSVEEFPMQFDHKSDLRQPGTQKVSIEPITATYSTRHFQTGQPRQRTVTADLYRPLDRSPAPVIVMSHGLGGSRKSDAFLAHHLTSHGFAVLMVQHPGSDRKQTQALFQGKSPHLFDINAFIDRPLDITAVLNNLETQNHARLQGRLDLQNVGVVGHSFGGYTALALAGAELNFAQLDHDCKTQSFLLNPSLLLQCRALKLPRKNYQLKDHRVKAILLTDPVNASIFGASGLQSINIPVLWSAGSADRVTPMALEHIHSFQALSTPHKYLSVTAGAHHNRSPISAAAPATQATVPTAMNDYLKATGLAFMQVHVRKDESYRPYLQNSYAQSISRAPFQLSLIRSNPVTAAIPQH